MEKPMTNELRSKIQSYIKNKLDISSLIEGVSIRGENLSHSIIKYFNRADTDISGCNFSSSKLGSDDGKVFQIIRCKMSDCNFENAEFVGVAHMRSCTAHKCDFRNANLAKVDYQYTHFGSGIRGSRFCNSIIRIGTTGGLGAVFPKEMFDDLCKGWKMKISAEEL